MELLDIMQKQEQYLGAISEDDYKMIISEDIDYNIQINKEELDKNSLEFYNLYLLVKDIVKKYYR